MTPDKEWIVNPPSCSVCGEPMAPDDLRANHARGIRSERSYICRTCVEVRGVQKILEILSSRRSEQARL